MKNAVVHDTFPKAMRLCFPGVAYDLNKTDWFVQFDNTSQIWFGGLDDKERTEKILGQEYCVDPAAKILTGDSAWIRADQIKVGQELIGFPEDVTGHIKLIPSFVERSEIIQAKKLKIVTDKGTTIVSENHQMVALRDDRRHRNARMLSWVRAKDLAVGESVRFTATPWEIGETRQDGWFSGMLDGEGWVSKPARMAGIAQCEGPVLDALHAWMGRNGIDYADRISSGKQGKRGPCHKLTASGLWASLRMLGITQPMRLDSHAIWEGCRAFTSGNGSARILEIEPMGVGPVVSMSTSSKTFIADGFLAHNCTIYLNECSQIPFQSREIALTRLAQKVDQQIEGRPDTPLQPRMYYDCNPPSKAHWSYKTFIQKIDPDTRKPLAHPDDYASFKMNPEDNAENLTAGYIQTLQGLSSRLRKRFLAGDWADATPNALFDEDAIEKWRILDEDTLPDMIRVVVAVDPSGADDADNADNDAIGIVVAGLGSDGNGYLLADYTVKAGPATWGRVATDAYDNHRADCIVAETNYGGAMVKHTLQVANPRIPYKPVAASRGKAVRAEPIAALYEKGKIRHVGQFRDLEDELVAFSTAGYLGEDSPNRADAAIWAFSALFEGIVKDKPKAKPYRPPAHAGSGSWMG